MSTISSLRSADGTTYAIRATEVDQKAILKALLEDPTQEAIELAKGYLAQCLEEALRDNGNQVFEKIIWKKDEEINSLLYRVSQLEQELQRTRDEYEAYKYEQSQKTMDLDWIRSLVVYEGSYEQVEWFKRLMERYEKDNQKPYN